MNKKLSKRFKLFWALSVVSIISIGCSNTEVANQEHTLLETIGQVTVSETLSTEESPIEPFIGETIHNHAHNIFQGIIGQTEIQMKISREDYTLTAAYTTRTDDEKFFEGKMKSTSEIELYDGEGGYLKGTIYDGSINGTAMISGENQVITLQLTTFFPVGYDYENYYSGVVGLACSSKEVEEFARLIKESINEKEKFLKLFNYPLEIKIEGEAITVKNEDEMAKQYDILMAQTDFREQIKNMYTKYLFLSYDGICVENGIIWFNKDSNGNYKIWSLNYRKSV